MRKPRILKENAMYHVTAKANRGELILEQDEFKQMFLDVLRRAKKKYSFILKSFCIMGNHVHLMVKPTNGESLSRIMQWIFSVSAVRFNHMNGFTGHVWYDRFHSKVIQSLRYYVKVFEYIADNPVKAGLCSERSSYPYGALWFMRRGRFDLADPPGSLLERYFPELKQEGISGTAA